MCVLTLLRSIGPLVVTVAWWLRSQVTFFRDCRPEKMTRYPGATETAASSPSGGMRDASISHRKLGPDSTDAGSPHASGQNRVLRTVYLPSERADALLLTTQSLQQQLDDTRKLMEDRAEVLYPDCVALCIHRHRLRY